MTTTGPGILENQNQMLGTKSRLVWETDWCKSAAATMQLPSEAQRFAAIDLRIDDNCKRSPPHPGPGPSSGPPLPAGPAWIHVARQNFCFVVVPVVYGGTFQFNAHLCLGTRRPAKDSRSFFRERRRMKTNDAPRLIIDPLLPEKGAETHIGVDYKWP